MLQKVPSHPPTPDRLINANVFQTPHINFVTQPFKFKKSAVAPILNSLQYSVNDLVELACSVGWIVFNNAVSDCGELIVDSHSQVVKYTGTLFTDAMGVKTRRSTIFLKNRSHALTCSHAADLAPKTKNRMAWISTHRGSVTRVDTSQCQPFAGIKCRCLPD